MATLGSLRLDIGLQLATLQSDMGKAAHLVDRGMQQIRASAENIAHIFEFNLIREGVQKLAEVVQKSVEQVIELSHLAEKTGIAAEQLSALEFAAGQTGTKIDELDTSLIKFNKSISDAAGGLPAPAAAFSLLGIKVNDANGKLKSSDQLLLEVAGKFAGMEDGANKTRLAIELFGRAGAQMIPFLNAGAAGISAYEAEARKLGVTTDQSMIEKAKAWQRELEKSSAITDAYKRSIVAGLLPGLQSVAGQFNSTAANARRFTEVEESARIVGKGLAIGIVVIKDVVLALGNVIGGVAAAISSLFDGLTPEAFSSPLVFAAELTLHAGNVKRALQILNDTRINAAGNLTDGIEEVAAIYNKSAADIAKDVASIGDSAKGAAPNLEGFLKTQQVTQEAAKKAAAEHKRLLEEQSRVQKEIGVRLGEAQADLQSKLGDKGEAALQKFDDKYRETIVQLQALGRDADLTDLFKLRDLTGAFGQIEELKQQASEAQNELALQEERIRNSREAGITSELDQMQQTGAARKETLAQMQQISAKWDEIAQKSGSKVLLDGAEKYKKSVEALAGQADVLRQRVVGSLKDAFVNFFDEITSRQKTFGQALADLGKQLLDFILKLEIEKAATAIVNSNGGQGLVGALVGLLGSSASGGGGGGGSVGWGRASGGPVMAGGFYPVNENGPELLGIGGKSYLMMGPQSGQVTPLQSGQGGGRPPVVITMHIHTPDADSFRRSQTQILSQAYGAAARARARNG